MFGHAYRGVAAPSQPRYFDEVDTVAGTDEADTFEVEPLDFSIRDLIKAQGIRDGFAIIYGNSGSESPGFATQSWDVWDAWDAAWDDHVIRMGIPIIVDESSDSEVDILVYQEQERANYLDGFQAPTARSYTYIEDFEPIEDQILIDGGRGYVTIMSDVNEPSLGDIGDDFEYSPLFQ